VPVGTALWRVNGRSFLVRHELTQEECRIADTDQKMITAKRAAPHRSAVPGLTSPPGALQNDRATIETLVPRQAFEFESAPCRPSQRKQRHAGPGTFDSIDIPSGYSGEEKKDSRGTQRFTSSRGKPFRVAGSLVKRSAQ
jgi:hypothetical protein